MNNEDRKLIAHIAKGAAEQVATRMLRDADNYLPVEMPPEIRAKLNWLENIQLINGVSLLVLACTVLGMLVIR